jgi:hypothetical protein
MRAFVFAAVAAAALAARLRGDVDGELQALQTLQLEGDAADVSSAIPLVPGIPYVRVPTVFHCPACTTRLSALSRPHRSFPRRPACAHRAAPAVCAAARAVAAHPVAPCAFESQLGSAALGNFTQYTLAFSAANRPRIDISLLPFTGDAGELRRLLLFRGDGSII